MDGQSPWFVKVKLLRMLRSRGTDRLVFETVVDVPGIQLLPNAVRVFGLSALVKPESSTD
jgi:hypothetical protein